MSNTPTIRFKGYVDNWESHLLGNIAEYSKGQGYSKNDLSEEGKPIILYGRLYTQYESTISEIDTFAEPHAGSVLSTGREVIIPASGETAEDIARASFVKQPGVLLGGDLNVLTPDQGIDPGFLALALSNGNARRELSVRAQGKTVVHIHNDDIKEVRVSIPSDKAEQERITEHLEQVDKLITSQQGKCEKLIALKAACLDKMFPKAGSQVPELRFAGFTREWEPHELGKLGTLKNGMNFSKDAMGHGFPFVNLQDVFGKNAVDRNNLGLAEATSSQLEDYNLIQGDVLFVRSSVKLEGVGEAAVIPQDFPNTTFSGFLIRFRDEYGLDLNYKRYLFSVDNVRRQILSQATNSANKNISQTVLACLTVLLPDVEEQKVIGNYLSNLDNLIGLNQIKLDKLRQFKQAMMHNMFV